jgi:hypothetical protein
MNFREFVKIYEAGGLFQNPGQPEVPDVHRGPSTNKDLYLHKFTGAGGAISPSGGASPGIGATAPGLSLPQPQQQQQQPLKRMKKMPKT